MFSSPTFINFVYSYVLTALIQTEHQHEDIKLQVQKTHSL